MCCVCMHTKKVKKTIIDRLSIYMSGMHDLLVCQVFVKAFFESLNTFCMERTPIQFLQCPFLVSQSALRMDFDFPTDHKLSIRTLSIMPFS